MKALCTVCKRIVQVCSPRGGDGTILRMKRHPSDPKRREAGSCKGSFHLVEYNEVVAAPAEEKP